MKFSQTLHIIRLLKYSKSSNYKPHSPSMLSLSNIHTLASLSCPRLLRQVGWSTLDQTCLLYLLSHSHPSLFSFTLLFIPVFMYIVLSSLCHTTSQTLSDFVVLMSYMASLFFFTAAVSCF